MLIVKYIHVLAEGAGMNANLIKASGVLAKVMEVFNWVLCVALVIGCALFALSGTLPTVSDALPGDALNVYGFEVAVVDGSGTILGAAVYTVLICGAVVASLVAMVFRNIYLIGRLTLGQSRHAKGAIPFQPDDVRMVREIGMFAISVPVVQLAFNIIARIAVGFDAEVSGFAFMGIVFGIAMLCLSQIFAYGMELQRDTDGLI